MSEIKTEIRRVSGKDSSGEEIHGFLISECNSIADVARFIIKEDWQDEILYFLNSEKEQGLK